MVLCDGKLVFQITPDGHSNHTAYQSTEDSDSAVQRILFESIEMKLSVWKSQIIKVICFQITHRSVNISIEPAQYTGLILCGLVLWKVVTCVSLGKISLED